MTGRKIVEDTRTNVRCQHCKEGFGLPAKEAKLLLKTLRVDVLCPHCMQITEVSALSRKKTVPSGSSGAIRAASVQVRKSPGPAAEMGRPPFQALEPVSRSTGLKPHDPVRQAIPFQLLSVGTSTHASSPAIARVRRQHLLSAKVRQYLPVAAGALIGIAVSMGVLIFSGLGKDKKSPDDSALTTQAPHREGKDQPATDGRVARVEQKPLSGTD